MPTKPSTEEGITLDSSIAALLAGMKRSLWVIAEYPLECIKTRWQGQLQNDKISTVVKSTYRQYGLRGYYHGFIPNLTKKIPAQAYRWTLLLQLPQFYMGLWREISERPRLHPDYTGLIFANILSGLSIAACETLIASPFEACKLELIIKKNASLWDYLRRNALSIKPHYLGVKVLAMKEAFGWVSFLTVCNLLRVMARESNAGTALKWHQYVYISVLTAAANATCFTPWDVIRTQIQKQAIESAGLSRNSATAIAKKIIASNGPQALWRGGGLRFVQLLVGTGLSLPVMEEYDASRFKYK